MMAMERNEFTQKIRLLDIEYQHLCQLERKYRLQKQKGRAYHFSTLDQEAVMQYEKEHQAYLKQDQVNRLAIGSILLEAIVLQTSKSKLLIPLVTASLLSLPFVVSHREKYQHFVAQTKGLHDSMGFAGEQRMLQDTIKTLQQAKKENRQKQKQYQQMQKALEKKVKMA